MKYNAQIIVSSAPEINKLIGLVGAFDFGVEYPEGDFICSSMSKNYTDIEYRTLACAAALELAKFDVVEYTITSTLLDVKMVPDGTGSPMQSPYPWELSTEMEKPRENSGPTVSEPIPSLRRF